MLLLYILYISPYFLRHCDPGVGGLFQWGGGPSEPPSVPRCSVISSENTFHGFDYPGRLHNYRGKTWSPPYTLPLKEKWCVSPSSKLPLQQACEKSLRTQRVRCNTASGRVTRLIPRWWVLKIPSESLARRSTGPVEDFQVKLWRPKTMFAKKYNLGSWKWQRVLVRNLFSFPWPCVPLFSVSRAENCTSIL